MKIGIISDTHIPDSADQIPKVILDAFKNVDMVIHAGDLVDLSVLSELKSICKNVLGVWGNMDPEEVRRELKEKEILQIGSHRIGLMHGSGSPNNLPESLTSVFKDDNVDIIIFGHSHNSMNEVRNGILFFNPGSATDKVFSTYNSYGIIEINGKVDAKVIKI